VIFLTTQSVALKSNLFLAFVLAAKKKGNEERYHLSRMHTGQQATQQSSISLQAPSFFLVVIIFLRRRPASVGNTSRYFAGSPAFIGVVLIMLQRLTIVYALKNPASKMRLLLYGSGTLALFAIYMWSHAGGGSVDSRDGISSLYDAYGGSGRARISFNIQDKRKADFSSTLAIANAPRDCCGELSASCHRIPESNHVLVFVSVPNVASETARRFPLRQQWHKSLTLMEKRMKRLGTDAAPIPTPRAALRFVIGTEGMDVAQVESMRVEAATHGDILLIEAPDNDRGGEPRERSSTTLKVMHSMRYAANNYIFEYFARVGDDAYFRVDFFAELVLIRKIYPRDNAYIGYKFANHVVRASDSTHNFIVGMGFLLSRDLTNYVCKSYPYLLDGFPEDAIVGSWFVGTKARVIHEPRFHDIDHITTVAYARCTNESLLLHHMWHQENWDAIDDDGLLEC
jgi:Galactosyltransferase